MIPLPFILLFWVWVYKPLLCFLSKKIFSICWRAGLVVLNSLSFCLSVKLLISPSYLNEILAGYSNLGCRFFSFITLSMSCHSLLAWRVSFERSAVILMGIPCVLFFVFPLLLLIFVLCILSLLSWLICDGSDGKVSTCNAGDLGSTPGSGRSPGEGNGNPLQCSYLVTKGRHIWATSLHFAVFHLGFILFGTLWVSWTWVAISFRILGRF